MLMMFVSGIYFPIEIMPSFLRGVSAAMPLRYMADAMRYVTGVMDMSDARFWMICASLLIVGAGLLPLLARYIVRADRR
jgi:ABC-2 type transport system permease protein